MEAEDADKAADINCSFPSGRIDVMAAEVERAGRADIQSQMRMV